MERTRFRPALAATLGVALLAIAAVPAGAYSGKGQELFDKARGILAVDPNGQSSTRLNEAVEALVEAQRLTTGAEEKASLEKWLARAYRSQANALHKEGDYTNAIWRLKETLKLDGENHSHYHALGRAYEASGDYYNAGLSFAKCLELGPPEMEMNTGEWLISAYMKLGETGDGSGYNYAVQEIDKLLGNHPGEGSLYREKAKALRELGDEAGAAEALRQAQERGILDSDGIEMLDKISSAANLKQREGFLTERSLHFVVEFKEGEESERWGAFVIETLEAAYDELGLVYQLNPGGKVQVSVYFDADYKEITNVAWSGGTQSGNRIDLRLRPESGEAVLVDKIYHEYSHYLTSQKANAQDVPGWLNEGFAMHHEKSRDLGRFYAELRDRMMRQPPATMTMAELTPGYGSFQGADVTSAYAHGYDMVRYFIERFREGSLMLVLEDLGDGEDFATVFRRQTSVDLADFEKDWRVWRRAEFEAGNGAPTRLAAAPAGAIESTLYGMER